MSPLPFAVATLTQDSRQVWATGTAVVVVAVALAFFVFFVAALVSILRSEQSGGMKLVWVVFAFCAPFLGSLLWFLIGRKHASPDRY